MDSRWAQFVILAIVRYYAIWWWYMLCVQRHGIWILFGRPPFFVSLLFPFSVSLSRLSTNSSLELISCNQSALWIYIFLWTIFLSFCSLLHTFLLYYYINPFLHVFFLISNARSDASDFLFFPRIAFSNVYDSLRERFLILSLWTTNRLGLRRNRNYADALVMILHNLNDELARRADSRRIGILNQLSSSRVSSNQFFPIFVDCRCRRHRSHHNIFESYNYSITRQRRLEILLKPFISIAHSSLPVC